jgi:MFS family permease
MVGNVGPLIAAFTANRISERVGVGRTIIAASVILGPTVLLIPFAPHGNAAVPFLIASFLVGGFANVIYNVTQVSLRQAITPERIQGRMNSVMRFIVWGTIPLGSLVGGVLASQIGLKETLIVGGIGSCVPFLPVLFSPVRSIRDMPEPLTEPPLLDPILADAEGAAVPASHI